MNVHIWAPKSKFLVYVVVGWDGVGVVHKVIFMSNPKPIYVSWGFDKSVHQIFFKEKKIFCLENLSV